MCPGSHKDFAANCSRGGKQPRGAFVKMSAAGDADYCASRAVQLAPLGAGDLVVWDSRVVHCSNGAATDMQPRHARGRVWSSTPAEELPQVLAARGLPDGAPQPSLLRLVAYVAMVPRAKASARQLEQRRDAVRRGHSGGHDPLRTRSRSESSRHYSAPPAGDPRHRLV